MYPNAHDTGPAIEVVQEDLRFHLRCGSLLDYFLDLRIEAGHTIMQRLAAGMNPIKAGEIDLGDL
jgi:hypothetical protein